MNTGQIKPEKVTKPFQLLATWLSGLVLLESILVVASTRDYPYFWINCLFAITAVVIIPLFLFLIF
jgi:hypothetical protein